MDPQQAQQVIQQVQQTTNKNAPIRIETKTGAVFEGQTQEEVLQKLVQSVESGSTHIKELRGEISTLRNQVQQAPSSTPPPGQKSIQDEYFEIWQKDPVAADRFAAAARLGVPIERVDQIERETIQAAARAQQQSAATEFMARCPDFPENDPAAAQAIAQRLQQRFPGQVPTADHLELVYNDLVRTGSITPRDIPIAEVVNPATPLPRLGTSQQQQTVDFERQFRSLSADQQKKVIEELAARGAR